MFFKIPQGTCSLQVIGFEWQEAGQQKALIYQPRKLERIISAPFLQNNWEEGDLSLIHDQTQRVTFPSQCASVLLTDHAIIMKFSDPTAPSAQSWVALDQLQVIRIWKDHLFYIPERKSFQRWRELEIHRHPPLLRALQTGYTTLQIEAVGTLKKWDPNELTLHHRNTSFQPYGQGIAYIPAVLPYRFFF